MNCPFSPNRLDGETRSRNYVRSRPTIIVEAFGIRNRTKLRAPYERFKLRPETIFWHGPVTPVSYWKTIDVLDARTSPDVIDFVQQYLGRVHSTFCPPRNRIMARRKKLSRGRDVRRKNNLYSAFKWKTLVNYRSVNAVGEPLNRTYAVALKKLRSRGVPKKRKQY